jgi:hypothetical protein
VFLKVDPGAQNDEINTDHVVAGATDGSAMIAADVPDAWKQ